MFLRAAFHHVARRPRRKRRGNIVISALLVSTGVGLCALVVDGAYLEAQKTTLQHVSDAAAAAAAGHLDGTREGMDAAKEAAVLIGAQHIWMGEPITIDPDAHIRFGVYDDDTDTFTENDDYEVANAVRVVRSGAIGTHFTQLVTGRASVQAAAAVGAKSPTAGGGASEVECYLPFALPDCYFDDPSSLGTMTLRLNPAGTDNAGWARVGANPSSSWIRAQLQDDCQDGFIRIGDSIDLNNGVITSALQEVGRQIEESSTVWDSSVYGPIPARNSKSAVPASAYGRTLEGVVPLFEADQYCTSGGGWTESRPVSGFAWVAVYDVVSTGKASGKNLFVRVDTVDLHEVGTRGGGPDHGVIAQGADGRIFE